MFAYTVRCAALAFVILMPPAVAQAVELYFAHLGTPGSLYDLSVNEFARRANAKLPAGYTVVPAGNSRFGYDDAVLQKLKTGEVAFGLPGTMVSGHISRKFGVFELPFLIRTRDQVRKISDALLEPYLQPEAKAKGYRILAIWENGFRQMTNSVRPIRRPADLRGLKMRVPPGPWWEKVFRTLGAEPVPLEFSKVYEALRTGAIDGQDMALALMYSSKFHDVQRYMSYSEHLFTPAYVVVSEEHFSKLPQPVQEVLTKTADEMRTWIFATAIRIESDLLDEVSDKLQTNQIDVKAFREVSRPLYGEFARTVPGGAKLISIVGALAEVDVGAVDAPDAK